MFSRRAIIESIVAAAILFAGLGISPRSAGQAAGLQQKLEAQYALTKTTDDKTDIVTAGAILILQKDKLIMYPTTTQIPPQNTYKDGRLSSGAFGAHQSIQKFGSLIGHAPPSQLQTASRNFVTGEKFWVTKIKVQPDEDAKSDDKGGDQQQGAAGGNANLQPPAEQAPAAPPATVGISQTVDEVVAILGQPDKIINLGPKQ